MTERDLQIGEEYVLELHDCCIKGTIQAGKFLEEVYDEDDVEKEYPTFRFENVTIGPHWGQWSEYRKDEK